MTTRKLQFFFLAGSANSEMIKIKLQTDQYIENNLNKLRDRRVLSGNTALIAGLKKLGF